MPLSNSVKAGIINCLNGKAQGFNASSNGVVYVGLSTTTPSADGTGITEPSDTNYKRVLLGMPAQSGTQKMSSATSSTPTSENTEPILFDKALTDWGTITHVVFFSAQTSGTFLGWSALTTSVSVQTGNVARIPIGDLEISIS